MKERVLRDTQIRSMHEMREIKRVQELRVEEFSIQKKDKITRVHKSNTSQPAMIPGYRKTFLKSFFYV